MLKETLSMAIVINNDPDTVNIISSYGDPEEQHE